MSVLPVLMVAYTRRCCWGTGCRRDPSANVYRHEAFRAFSSWLTFSNVLSPNETLNLLAMSKLDCVSFKYFATGTLRDSTVVGDNSPSTWIKIFIICASWSPIWRKLKRHHYLRQVKVIPLFITKNPRNVPYTTNHHGHCVIICSTMVDWLRSVALYHISTYILTYC